MENDHAMPQPVDRSTGEDDANTSPSPQQKEWYEQAQKAHREQEEKEAQFMPSHLT